ncbi:MAG: DoxX family protein [Gemmatimonadota bacterium]
MDRLASAGLLVSRVLLASVFLFAGASKTFAFAATQQYMAAQGMKMTGLFLVLAILVEIGGGLSVLLGFVPRLGALALFLFLIPVTLVFHRNWSDPVQLGHFVSNLGLMGGLMAIVSVGGGVFSVRARKGRA